MSQSLTSTGSQPAAREILFVDAGVPEAEILLAGLSPTVEVVRLAADRDGLDQITEALAGRSGITALHVLGHGAEGEFNLGNAAVTAGTVDARAEQIASWQSALTADADILLYGCDVAGSAGGEALLSRLAAASGADVAASTDLTGAAALGGDWELEAQTGSIEASLPFSAEAVENWQHTLNHFRYATMSWEPVAGSPNTVLIKGSVDWTANHSFTGGAAVGAIAPSMITLDFGDGTTQNVSFRILSRDPTTNDAITEFVTDLNGNGTIEANEVGVQHTYATGGEHVVTWSGGARETARNLVNTNWQQTMTVDLDDVGNRSPIVAVPAVVQVPDNAVFTYQIVAADPNRDTLRFRYGTQDEFYNNNINTEATRPTGLTITPNGLITWDVTDAAVATATNDRWQVTVMVEDLDAQGNVLSSVPVDFVFKIVPAGSQSPVIEEIASTTQQAVVNEMFHTHVVMDDPDSDTPPVLTVLNPPSTDPAIFSTETSSEGGKTTLHIKFIPTPDMRGDSYVLNIRGRDGTGMTTDQSITIEVPSTSLRLTAATDTGRSDSDGLTKVAAPTIAGETVANYTVELKLDGSTLTTVTAGADGKWSYTLPGNLADGPHEITAVASDGSSGALTTPVVLSVEVDTAAPTTLAAPVRDGSDAHDTTPTVSGTAVAGDYVTLNLDGVATATVTAGSDGTWQHTFSALAPGAHTVTAVATDAAGNESVASAPLALYINSPTTGSVTVDGSAAQGEVLTANTSAMADADGVGTLAYLWQRDDGNGGWTAITGATGSTYQLGQADVGHSVRVVTSFTDGAGLTESVTSAALATPVANVDDAPGGTVTISGTVEEGGTLTVTDTLTDADGLGAITYRWQRDDGQGGWSDIDGATGSTYGLVQADAGHSVRAVASFTDGFGHAEEVASAATGTPVANVNDAPGGAVTISGTPGQGELLIASNTLTDADGLGPITYRWQRDDEGGNWSDIAGATGSTYTLGQDDVGHAVRAVASFTDGFGTAEEVASAATTSSVANVDDAPGGTVTISGTVEEGGTLTVTDTLTDADGLGAITYRWQRDDGQGGWSDIDGATGSTYGLVQADAGHSVRAVASFTDGFGHAEEVASAATGTPVANVNDAPGGAVTISGTPGQGELLIASNTLTDADGLGPITYRWQRDDEGGNWSDIAGATGSTYTLGQDDVGHAVRAVASFTDGFGTAEEVASAATTSSVANVDDAPTGAVTVTGDPAQGALLTADTSGLADADGLGALSYRWQRDDGQGGWSDVNGATGSTYRLGQEDVGHSVRTVVSFTDGFGHAEQVTGIGTAAPVANVDDAPTGNVALSGTPMRGETLVATRAFDDADGVGDVSYRWQREDGQGGWADISGAAGTEHQLVREDIGHAVRAVASYTDGFGHAEQVFSANAAVQARPVPLPPPVEQVSHAPTMSSTEIAVRLADGDTLAPSSDTGTVVLQDGLLSFGANTDASFLTRLYLGILDRAGEANGLSYWAKDLGKTLDKTDVARGFLEGTEYKAQHGEQTDDEFISTLYGNVLHREGEAEGQAFYRQQLTDGLSRAQVLVNFVDSAEAKDVWKSATEAGIFVPGENIGFIRAAYITAFDRDAESAGLAYYADNMQQGMTREEFSNAIENSPEFQTYYRNVSDQTFLNALYQNALERDGEADGMAYYEGKLADHSMDRGDVVMVFALSPEAQQNLEWSL
ncbi:DUF4347 domain-containing protein [Roseomonas sp. BN140053]|uniref:DUF4347 domain-containing protein n=1 Tax=Roseomonas sp. BN140053 TaxID=3391898 RepID=UPI0039ECA6EB